MRRIAVVAGIVVGGLAGLSSADGGVQFFTDEASWTTAAGGAESLPPTEESVESAEEVGDLINVENSPQGLGPVLTFHTSNTGLSRNFRMETLQNGAEFVYNDDTTTSPTPFFEAISVGSIPSHNDDDWSLEIGGGPPLYAIGFDLGDNQTNPGESLRVYDVAGGLLGELLTIPVTPARADLFLGAVSDVPIGRIVFDEDVGLDNIAISNFRFGASLEETNRVLKLTGGSHVEVPDSPSLSIAQSELSVSVWIKKESETAMAGTVGSILDKTGLSAAANGGYMLRFEDLGFGFQNSIYFVVGDGSGGGLPSAQARGVAEHSILDAGWHHIVGVYNAGVVRVYVDGVDSTTLNDQVNPGPIKDNDAPMFIGRLAANVHNYGYFKGCIEDLAIWDRALTCEDIQSFDWHALTGTEDGIVAFWKFDNNPVPDRSGNGNAGTLSGAAVLVEESELELGIATAVEVYFASGFPTTGYQLQYATPPALTNWTNLGKVFYGSGAEVPLFDSTRGLDQRVYRIIKQ